MSGRVIKWYKKATQRILAVPRLWDSDLRNERDVCQWMTVPASAPTLWTCHHARVSSIPRQVQLSPRRCHWDQDPRPAGGVPYQATLGSLQLLVISWLPAHVSRDKGNQCWYFKWKCERSYQVQTLSALSTVLLVWMLWEVQNCQDVLMTDSHNLMPEYVLKYSFWGVTIWLIIGRDLCLIDVKNV